MLSRRRDLLLIAASLMLLSSVFLIDGAWIKAKAVVAQWLIASSWQSETSESRTDYRVSSLPWPWADTWPMAKLEVPHLNITQYVMAGLDGESLAFGPGMDPLSTEDSGLLLAGHKDTHFDYLQRLSPGDKVHVTLKNREPWEFEVTATAVVELTPQVRNIVVKENQLALVTCYPFGIEQSDPNKRYLVLAERRQRELASSSEELLYLTQTIPWMRNLQVKM
ncbi:class GN sortase [Corallincola platygyrae]|uniref:Class GN sortase n=1 Tax=Corallincola platygyrae TaxID=1193278 RepID=A0ABW4XI98_9GAMM